MSCPPRGLLSRYAREGATLRRILLRIVAALSRYATSRDITRDNATPYLLIIDITSVDRKTRSRFVDRTIARDRLREMLTDREIQVAP